MSGARIPLSGLGALVASLAFAWASVSADHAPSVPGVVDIIAVDTDPAGNTPTSVSAINGCRTSSLGQTFDIDVIVDEIDPADGISSVEFDLMYDSSVISIVGRSLGAGTLIGQAGSYLDISDALPDSDGDYHHGAFDLDGPHESGPGVLVRLTMQIVGTGVSPLTLTDNIEMDGVPNIRDAAEAVIPINQVLGGQVRADGSSCEPDDDADGWVNSADNCRYWFNPSQALPPWSVPAGDSDCDGFPDTVTASGRGRENFITTDATDSCADTAADHAWPPDVNNGRSTNLSDVVLFGPTFNKSGPGAPYNRRFDLNALPQPNGAVNLSDVVAIGPFFNKSCS